MCTKHQAVNHSDLKGRSVKTNISGDIGLLEERSA